MVGLVGKGTRSRHDSLRVTLVGQELSFLLPVACPMAQVLEGPKEIVFGASFWLKSHMGLPAPI